MKITQQIQKLLNVCFEENKLVTPVEWAETNRVMTSDVSNFSGKFRYSRNPYMREIVNRLMPNDPARKVAVMKGAQIGVSTCVLENGIGWIIRHNPANVLLASADQELVKEQFETKLDNMIQNSGLRDYIRPNVVKKRNSRTGDTNSSKEFPGGRLYGRSVQNAGKWRQTSFKFGFIDDFEAADRDDKREGSVVDLINQRFASYGNTHKIFYISTPALKRTSNIEPLYEAGDKRKFVMPCPCCGAYIPFEFQLRKDKQLYGIVWEANEKGELIEDSVMYRCQECGDRFPEAGNKADMLANGFWQPTKEPDEPGFFSYHISALYAAPGMYDWTHYVRQFLKANKSGSAAELKTFANVVLGQTWEDRGNSVKATKISRNTRAYPICTVPSELSRKDGNGEIVMLTCACDLNGLCQGVNSEYCDARLDYEVLAHSRSGATYSIDSGSIGTFQRGRKRGEDRAYYSLIPEHEKSVWREFAKIINRVYDTDDGRRLKIMVSGVDSGSFTQYAYQFVESRSELVLALKGDPEHVARRVTADTKVYRPSRERNYLFHVTGNLIKDDLAVYMNLEWTGDGPQPPNFMNYPTPEAGKYTVPGYFIEYEGEEKQVDINKTGDKVAYTWRKKNSSSRNHFWDCRVYNLALRDIFMNMVMSEAGVKYPTWGEFCNTILK